LRGPGFARGELACASRDVDCDDAPAGDEVLESTESAWATAQVANAAAPTPMNNANAPTRPTQALAAVITYPFSPADCLRAGTACATETLGYLVGRKSAKFPRR